MAIMITREVLEVGGGGGGGRISYEDWSDCLQSYLLSRDLWHGFIIVDDDEQPISSEEDDDWRRKNAAALHAIKFSCGSGVLRQIRGCWAA
ncbi:unnamed protein product [Linum tenue]|uniref:Uncharacterized protein n=1 Tax=Linum tenue TaxID=586396 RepID=A0AAV0RI45_9ROSI|nr:unnamed protein product [Linum tenue]